MKKFTAIIMAAFMVLSLAGCSSGNSVPDAESSGAATSEVTSAADTSTAPAAPTEPTAEPTPTEPTAEPAPAVPTAESEPTAEPTAEPETSVPETTVPETSVPETTVPETTPATTVPETTKPATTKPETTKPATTVSETTPAPEEPEVIEEIDPVTLLNNTWALFGEDELFPVTGGDFSSGELIQEAASFSLETPDSIDYVAGFPAAEIDKIDSAATLMHMMNQNTFTAGAYHVVEGADIDALGQAVKDNIMNRMWMCGFPDKLIVVNVGDYLVSAFGKNQPIDNFAAHLVEAYPSAVIVVDEPIL